ncbi:hypothetical protein [Embleya sp. NPDC059259]|uniref:hypothetical protein n=1 Tax=unclassified Embleya TaxID=2699296 RepID=UPI0036751EC6
MPGSPSTRYSAARAGLDGANDVMFATVTAMSPDDRRGAANTAIDTLAGVLGMGMAGPHCVEPGQAGRLGGGLVGAAAAVRPAVRAGR